MACRRAAKRAADGEEKGKSEMEEIDAMLEDAQLCGAHEWPAPPDGDSAGRTVRPRFPIIMCMKTRNTALRECDNIDDFKNEFGHLPDYCKLLLVKMANVQGDQISEEHLQSVLPVGEILDEASEDKEFGCLSDPMKTVYQAGFFDMQRRSILNLAQQQPPEQRVHVLYNWMAVQVQFLEGHIANGDLRDDTAKYQLKFIQHAGHRVFKDLRLLRKDALAQRADDANIESSCSYWRKTQPDPFVAYAWELHELHWEVYRDKQINMYAHTYGFMMNMIVSAVLYRMGEQQPGWVIMGAMNVVMEAGGKMPTS